MRFSWGTAAGRYPAALLAAAALLLAGCSAVTARQASAAAARHPAVPIGAGGGTTCYPGNCPAGPPAGSRALCRDIPRLTRLTVRRYGQLPQGQLRRVVPAVAVADRRGDVQNVARALCALPRDTLVNCPADRGIYYRLDFGPARLGLAPVGVSATGCSGVTGIGKPVRFALPRFWRVLAVAMGLTRPGTPGLFADGRP